MLDEGLDKRRCGEIMGTLKPSFHNKPGSKGTVLKNRAVLTLIVVAVFCGAVVFCGLLGLLGTTQGHASQGSTCANWTETGTVPTPDFRVRVSPAEVCANVGEQIEICCNISCRIYTPVEVTSVEVVLFDSYNSTIREQVMTKDSYWSARTEYTIVGDEAYYKLKINFIYRLGPSGEYTDYTAHSFPIVVNQERG
jgi:hypothetical protein